MPAVHKDLNIEQGTTWSYGWAVLYQGQPIDSTWEAKAEARGEYDGRLLHEFTATVTPEGAVVIAVEPYESDLWPWYDGLYDVKVFGPEGVELRVAEGRVTNDRGQTP